MQNISDLLRAQNYDEEAVHARLEDWGFVEPPPPQKPQRRAFAGRKSVAIAPPRLTDKAEKLIDSLATSGAEREALFKVLDDLLEDLSRAAQPLRALLNFSNLCDACGERIALFHRLASHPALRERLARLLGFAQSLADTLIRDPSLLDMLEGPPATVSRANLRVLASAAVKNGNDLESKANALRRFRRRQTLRIGVLDMERATWRSTVDFHLVVRQISDLAQVCVETALGLLESGENIPFTVIALGKLGARELNYSSDIDLIFLQDGQSEKADELGRHLVKVLGDVGEGGLLWRVDMRLRPEGTKGPLVTPLDYALSYYESFAGAWEWQALIKSRAIAGDANLAKRFRRFTHDVTWARRADDAHLREIVEMKKRSEATAKGCDEHNVKDGPGGIRDAEWVIQQLQMMIGPQYPAARAKDSLRAIEVLVARDALTLDQARALQSGLLFLRTAEHRMQLWEEQAIRVLPESVEARAALARRLGSTWRGQAAARWLIEEHDFYRKQIRTLCERLFWGWRESDERGKMNDERGIVSEPEDNGHSENINHSKLNIQNPSEARLRRLAEGTSTQPLPAPLARQIKAVLPAVVKQAERAADPESALANIERLCESSGNRLSLLRSLADTPRLGRAVLTILGGSQVLSDTLIRSPELLDMAAHRSLLDARKTTDEARADCRSYCLTFRDHGAALRRWKAREMLRIGLRDLVLDASPHDITGEIAALCGACLDFATEETGATLRPDSQSIAFCILGMGKLGGREMHYSSDADIVFSHEVLAGETGPATATRWAKSLIQLMGERTEDGMLFQLDARLRPEGRNGPLAPSLEAFVEYFERADKPGGNGLQIWERQALTRARFVAGDAGLAARLMAAISHVAFPENWLPEWSDELRHIKDRVEAERASKSKGSTKSFDVKLGVGGLTDIEWTSQWLALRWGAKHPALQTRSTLFQIEAARESGVLSEPDAKDLEKAYTFLRRAELRLQIVHERAISSVQKDSNEWKAWIRSLYSEDSDDRAAELFEKQWETHTGATRRVFEKVRATI